MQSFKDVDYEKIAWLLGVISGDGHIDKYFVEISDMHYENLVVVSKIIQEMGYRTSITADKHERRYRLWVNNISFVRLVKEIFGLKRNGLIPTWIKKYQSEGDLVVLKGFIRGLYDAEGYIEYWKPRKTLRINFTNTFKGNNRFCAFSS